MASPAVRCSVQHPSVGGGAASTGTVEIPLISNVVRLFLDKHSAQIVDQRQEMIHVTQAAGSVLQAEALRVGDLKLLWHPAGTDCSVSHPGWCV